MAKLEKFDNIIVATGIGWKYEQLGGMIKLQYDEDKAVSFLKDVIEDVQYRASKIEKSGIDEWEE